MMQKKIKLTTNRGKLFDWALNKWLNWVLYINHVDNDADDATELVARELRRLRLV